MANATQEILDKNLAGAIEKLTNMMGTTEPAIIITREMVLVRGDVISIIAATAAACGHSKGLQHFLTVAVALYKAKNEIDKDEDAADVIAKGLKELAKETEDAESPDSK
jgi:hypothetical protein